MKNITKKFIANLIKDPIATLSKLEDNDIATLIQKANYEYYNSTEPLFSDDIYDIIKDYLESRNPHHPILKSIGAAIGEDERKEKLPYFLASLDKIKTDDKAFQTWLQKHTGPYIVSDKLDGNSALLHWKGGNLRMFSRGDGNIGQNISHMLPLIKGIPKFKEKDEIAIRGELIMSKLDFEKIKHKGANARNMVAGVVNAKIPDLEISALTQFVAYELIHPVCPPSEQYALMKKMGCTIAYYEKHDSISLEKLSRILETRREKSMFEVDGIVITHDKVYKRVRENPSYAFAFKALHTMQKAEVIVTHVEWNMSKDGYLIPVVNFNEVRLAGVVIKRAHGFNGKFIKDNKIGPGSRILIMRSGDVIPYILEVLSEGEAQMPDLDYEWTKSGVDIMLPSKDKNQSQELKLKNIQYFFTKIDVKGLGPGNVKKIFDAGFDTISKIYNASATDLGKVDGFKSKIAGRLFTALQESRKGLHCVSLMDASNTLGRGIGRKKIELIVSNIPDILTAHRIPGVNELILLKGIEKTTAESFITNLPAFFEFLRQSGLECDNGDQQQNGVDNNISAPLFIGQKIAFTGFRDAALEALIKARGGEISTGVTKNTTLVITKDTDKESSKLVKAREMGIKILRLTDFLKEYQI